MHTSLNQTIHVRADVTTGTACRAPTGDRVSSGAIDIPPTKPQTKKGVTEVTPNVSRTDLQNEGHVPSGVLLRADNSPPAPSAPAGGATCAGFAWVGLRRSPAG